MVIACDVIATVKQSAEKRKIVWHHNVEDNELVNNSESNKNVYKLFQHLKLNKATIHVILKEKNYREKMSAIKEIRTIRK